MKQSSDLIADLKTLNELLVKERVAITRQEVHRLIALQQEKGELLEKLSAGKAERESGAAEILRLIRKNIRRNRFLLNSGARLFAGMQEKLIQSLSCCYSHNGSVLATIVDPKILRRSV